jgi:peptide chain release factor 1
MEPAVREKLLGLVAEAERLSREMSNPAIASDPNEYRQRAQKLSGLQDVVGCFQRYQEVEKGLVGAEEMLYNESDPELHEMAEEEKRELSRSLVTLEEELKILLLPRDPNDEKNTIMEIRAGTGGEEAALFVSDLFRMYSRYAEKRRWRIELLGSNPTGIGGYREISFKIDGDHVFSRLKFEGGVHRVQRVPATEAQGRIHTSTVTVAVLPEAEEVDIEIPPADIQFDVFRSSGPGGQSVNTTDSAVRLTHKPTGMVVSCQDEKSQFKNKAKALAVLRARLLAKKQEEENALRSANRKSQVGTGDRSERIRTYNFPENRVTDHRIKMTVHNLDIVLEGELDEVIDALSAADRAARMAEA